jgi:predicted cupin superfamily sugar epimerase
LSITRDSGRVAELIETLGLQPHPEGGFYKEVFRSTRQVQPSDERGKRHALTTIYFLLPAGQVSRWHRVSSDEVWHLYEGGPLELLEMDAGFRTVDRIVLGTVSAEHRPVHTVPADRWQAARPLGAYALAGCTVGPGFEFADFRMLEGDDAATVAARWPELAQLA